MRLVEDKDIFAVTNEPEKDGVESIDELANRWDSIGIN